MRVLTLLAVTFLLLEVFIGDAVPRVARAQTPGPPNIILILTDDQRFDTLKVMPEVRRHLVARGMTLRRAIVTNPLCCPSRATILTGRYSHTTGVYFNSGPFGGWPAFQPSESSTIATALDAAGYRTALIGKYINGYKGPRSLCPVRAGIVGCVSLSDGAYYNYEMFDDAAGPGLSLLRFRPVEYSTDVIRRKAVGFIRSSPVDTPFFLMLTPYAPHGPMTPAPRDVRGLLRRSRHGWPRR